jgi:3-hydroxybutyryl-CoA dehydratase
VSARGKSSGKTIEDFQVGETIETAGRTVEMSDILTFAGLTGDHYPLHVNEEYARHTQFGGRIAHGPLTFAFAVGQVALHGWYGDAIVALKECTSLRATAPVRPGDTLRVRATVVELADARRPEHGTLHVDYDVLNQQDASVMTFRWIMIAHRRTPVEASDD